MLAEDWVMAEDGKPGEVEKSDKVDEGRWIREMLGLFVVLVLSILNAFAGNNLI